MELDNCKTIYFLGIGGVGMSALARYFLWRGVSIHGYDKTPTSLTGELINEGMNIHFEEDISAIPAETDLVVYTPAIPENHKEFQYFKEKQIPVKKRSEVLGMISQAFRTFAVAGTHGKTTTSVLLAHIFHTAERNILAFLGGISKNYSSNFIFQARSESGQTSVITEADEYDRSFLQLHPFGAIITSMDDDHLDVYGNSAELTQAFSRFASQIQPGGILICKKGVNLDMPSSDNVESRSYSVEEEADYYPVDIITNTSDTEFTLITPENRLERLVLGIPGRFNLENAIAASALSLESGIQEEKLREALKTFSGVRRRFSFMIFRDDLVYIDDYAHHPEELKACIYAVKEIFPERRITGVFQPHLYSRTKDFADEFARSLELLDEVLLLDIYPARELPVHGVDSGMILEKIRIRKKFRSSGETLIEDLKKLKPEVILTLGAGDIDQWVEKIVEAFKNG